MPQGALGYHFGLDAALLSCNELAVVEVATSSQELETRMASTLSSMVAMDQPHLTSQ